MHSLGEALRGFLQDLPAPVVPASVHGEILSILQGKGSAAGEGKLMGRKWGRALMGSRAQLVLTPVHQRQVDYRAARMHWEHWRVRQAWPLPFQRVSCFSPEIPQPESCRKQLLLALESPAVPLQNLLTLQFLLHHLGKVSQQAESNGLHPRALGEIFGPLLLRLPGTRYMGWGFASHQRADG